MCMLACLCAVGFFHDGAFLRAPYGEPVNMLLGICQDMLI